MMNVMETPEQRDFVVEDVPVVRAQIQQKEPDHKLHPDRHQRELKQAK